LHEFHDPASAVQPAEQARESARLRTDGAIFGDAS
jgi:hypothetical protein